MTTNTVACYNTLIRPAARWMEVPILLAFNLLLVASAYLSIHLPFSPVPVTGQTLGVLLVAMALGRTRGVGVVLAYLAEGAAGLPVFAGGTGSLVVLFGPTGGYLLGFVAAAYVVGSCSDRGWHTSYIKSMIAMIAGTAVIFAAGLSWLAFFVPAASLLNLGFWPFLPGAALKLAVASAALPTISKFVHRG
ncbi:MAG: biotin transporter BioY [bacterium]